jgi:hypothetical protein
MSSEIHLINAKLEEADGSPDNEHNVPILLRPQVLETQDNLEEPKGEGDSILFEASI